MAKIVWDAEGERIFETGLDRGVLYPNSGPGVAWNGLVQVDESPSGGEATPYYIDGYKFLNEPTPEEFEATIEAYTYPDEFSAVDGLVFDDTGLGFTSQPRQSFGLSYRTMVGNDVGGIGHGYKLHLIFNALASPTQKPYATISDDPEALTFSWNITASPMFVSGRRPTAHLVVDSTRTKSDTMNALEDILYGTSSTSPRLPTAEEINTLFRNWEGFQILEKVDTGISFLSPLGADDLKGNQNLGIYEKSSPTRLSETSVPGIYRLD